MKTFACCLLITALSMIGLVGCSGDSNEDKPKFKTEPYREVGQPRTEPPDNVKTKPGIQ